MPRCSGGNRGPGLHSGYRIKQPGYREEIHAEDRIRSSVVSCDALVGLWYVTRELSEKFQSVKVVSSTVSENSAVEVLIKRFDNLIPQATILMLEPCLPLDREVTP